MNRQIEIDVTPNPSEISTARAATDVTGESKQRLQQAARILATGAIRAALKKKQAATRPVTPSATCVKS